MSTKSEATIKSKIENLKKAVDLWIDTEVRAANEQLYLLLGRCLEVSDEIVNSRQLVLALDELLKGKKIRIYGEAGVIAKVVRLVFVSKSSQWAGYTRALLAARKAGIDREGFPDWLKGEGGVEAFQSSKAKSAKDTINYKARADAALSVDAQPIADNMVKISDLEGGRHVLLYGYVQNGGSVEIYAALSNQHLVDEFKEQYGRKLVSESEAAAALSASHDPEGMAKVQSALALNTADADEQAA